MKDLKKLIDILDKWKPYYVMAGFLLILSSFARMIEPKVLQIAVDGVVVFFQDKQVPSTGSDPVAGFFYRILPEIRLGNLHNVLLGLGGLFMVIALIRGATMFVASVVASSSTEKAVKKLRDRLFGHIQALPLTYHKTVPTGEMVQRCTGDIDTVRRFIINDIVEVIRLSAVFVGAFLMMVSVHVTYAFIAIAAVPFIAITAFLFFKKEQHVWQEHEDEQDKLTAIIQENLTGIRVVKAFAREDFEIDKFMKQSEVKRNVGMKHIRLHSMFWPFSDALVNLQITVSLMAGAYFVVGNQISIGEFASFFTYSIMVTWPLRHVGQIVSRMGMAVVAIDRMSSILESDPEDYTGINPIDKKLNGHIEFRNVSFRYPGEDNAWALRNVSFEILPGKKVALIGPTGAGKTTLISLLSRFFEPTEGEIFLDGISLSKYSKTYLRSRIGIVLQKAFLFSSSIRSNIAYANPDAGEDFVHATAEAASIDHLMDRFPEGFDTVVGEKGVTLSGGQKQRVALARILLSDPDIMVLDDTTSAVDTETEFAIQQALSERLENKTAIIIAHRVSSIEVADKVLVLEEGRVTDYGSVEEVLDSEGFFSEIYRLQSSLEEEISKEI